ncbi:hypothetical protein Ahy_A09g044895 [Arachis hypogaea]|uniref:Ubiquitin-like protease family profile domain-containing protein n=1 Tax=Arachis hypogaea TaxID=3818 RepID=A0A445BLA0_ARAHY|nr:hypothetical protein Ahy_A09g044895 [Arachis hypogaea]
MSEEKKTIVRDLGFGGLMHIPPLRVHHQILRELANSFKLGDNRLQAGYSLFKVTPKTIGAALGINASGEMMAIGVDNEQDRLMFKRIFILYIQMAFLLPTTINKISPVHLAPIFKMDTITERNWRAHVLNFIIKGITDYNLKKKKAIDGCLFVLMIFYFHLSKNKDNKRAERPPEPLIANWTKEMLVERMRAEMEEHMKTQRIQQENNPPEKPKKWSPKKRKKIQEDSDSESESTGESEESSPVEKHKTKKKTQRTPKKTQSKKKKVIVEDSSPEQAQSYHGSEIGTEDLDEFLRENNEKSAAQGEKEADLRSMEGYYVSSEMLSLVEESASELAEENMMVVMEETPSEVLAINPAPEDAAALMIMARTASYVPKTDPMPSFNLGLTDSSQEKAATQEGASTQDGERAKTHETPKLLEQLGDLVEKIVNGGVTTKEKSPQIQKESGGESFEKFETPARTNENTSDMKQKCYLWVEDYPMFIPFLDLKKLASHRYIFAPVCHSQHWWLWLADARKQKFYIVDPYHTKSPSEERTALNTFIHEVDHFRVEYASQILFHDMNQDKAEAIRGSNAIRQSKPSTL